MDSSDGFKKFYDVFRDVSTLVHSSTQLEEVQDLVVWKISEVLGAKGAVLRAFDPQKKRLSFFAAYGLGEEYLSKVPLSAYQVIAETCNLEKATIISDIMNDPRVQHPKDLLAEGVQMILEIPLKLRPDMIGMIRVYFEQSQRFSEEELDLWVAIGQQCACALEKTRLIEEQQSQFDHLVIQTEKLSALGRMAAGIAHEINNPLAGILLFSTNMRKKAPEGPLTEGLDVIIRESQRCKGIIQDLLEFSRDNEPEKVLTSVNEIIKKTLSIMENEFSIHHISVEMDLSVNMPDICLDGNLMQQVFLNLFMNAKEAIQEDGVITVKTRMSRDRKSEVIEITDSGCGIPQDQMNKIFEPFFSTKANGTGLGLAVSYGIVQKHRGDIEVSSRPGHGTCFIIHIPVAQEK
jgi:signal transduction histidine kinase